MFKCRKVKQFKLADVFSFSNASLKLDSVKYSQLNLSKQKYESGSVKCSVDKRSRSKFIGHYPTHKDTN
jgi:hypothetical protein